MSLRDARDAPETASNTNVLERMIDVLVIVGNRLDLAIDSIDNTIDKIEGSSPRPVKGETKTSSILVSLAEVTGRLEARSDELLERVRKL